MKKLGFVAIAVLAAALIAGCDFVAPDLGGVENSRQVKIAIENYGSAGARSLIRDVAEFDMDYVEVVFRKLNSGATLGSYDPADYETYRQGWKVNNIGTIGIPEDFDIDNDPTCEAVLFGGLNDGKVLLAVGRVLRINTRAPGDPGYKSLIEGGDTVTFKMAALTSLVSTKADETTFKITGPAGQETPVTGDLPTLKNKGKDIPVFTLASRVSDVTATYEFGIELRAPIHASTPTGFGDYAKYILKDGESSAIRQMGTTLDLGYTKAAVESPNTPNFYDDKARLPSFLNIEFNTQDDGLCTLFLRAPVYMFGMKESSYYGEPVRHTKWYIQGGLDNSLLDDGTGKREIVTNSNGTGGSILLGIGNYEYREKPGSEIEIEW